MLADFAPADGLWVDCWPTSSAARFSILRSAAPLVRFGSTFMNSPSQSTIVIVEDNDTLRLTLADMLELNGFNVVTAANGIEGLAMARNKMPALVITDLQMPGMTGFELLSVLREDKDLRGIPVIMMSGKNDRATTRRGMELGAADFITKPFSEDEVIRSITTRLKMKALLDDLDAFGNTVAHDLKNPLSALNSRLELAGLMLGSSDEALVREQLTEATASARRLCGIIDELLILAGIRREAIDLLPLDMTAVVTESLHHLGTLLRKQSASIQTRGPWPAAMGHAPWVVQVWVNFISNAAKYGGPQPQITIGGEACPDRAAVRFWVQDNGPGLDPTARNSMFAESTKLTPVRISGHGLGLAIVRRIVEKLDGHVGVESSPGTGARFWFELPAAGPGPT